MTSKELISCNLLIICWFQLSCQRFKIYFIIKDLNSVYGIEQLIGYWNIQCVLGFPANDWPLPIGKRENSNTSWIFFHQKRQRTSKQNVLHYLLHWQMVIVEKQAAVWKQLLILLYHIFSGKYSSFEYLIRCQMPTLYHTPTLLHTPTLYRTPTLYTLLFKYMIKCIKHGTIHIICRISLHQYHPSGLKALWMILVSRDDTAYDTDFAMYYSQYITILKTSVYICEFGS